MDEKHFRITAERNSVKVKITKVTELCKVTNTPVDERFCNVCSNAEIVEEISKEGYPSITIKDKN